MKIHSIRLKHFKPVKYSLLGREEIMLDLSGLPDGLVAIAGKNGAAKTTILDNLHPFQVMPFRASKPLYDMVYGTEAEKDLVWEHDGSVYRSILKLNGKTREMSSSLYKRLDDGSWGEPIVDGRNRDYLAAVEKILGISEKMFLLTRFRSQDAASFVKFKKNDFREVFESMIPELEYFLGVSSRASEQRGKSESELATLQRELASVEQLLASLPDRKPPEEGAIESLEKALEDKRVRAGEIQELVNNNAATLSSQEEQARALAKSLSDIKDRLAKREKEISDRKTVIARKTRELNDLISKKEEITKAKERLSPLREQLRVMQEKLKERSVLLAEVNDLSRSLTGLKAQAAALRKELASAVQIAELLHEVPCDGEEKQSSCKLLASGVEMAAKVPGMKDELEYLLDTIAMSEEELKEKNELMASKYPEAAIPQSLLDDISRAQAAAARADLLAHAEGQLADLSAEAKTLEQTLLDAQAAAAEESSSISSRLEEIKTARTDLVTRNNETKAKKTAMEQEISDISSRAETLRTDKRLYEENERRKTVMNEQIVKMHAGIEKVTKDVRQWKLIQQGFGREGLIALELTIAAPSVSDIANALLTEMGGRFAIRFDTLEPRMTRGKVTGYKESFTVKVFDAEKGIEKDLDDLSGGERVWVDESIARGIGIYNSRNTRSNLGFLVSDEKDGALDKDKKLEYVAMKRKVIELGGDRQEIFISHTPEVWDLADEVIVVGADGVRLRSGVSVEVDIPRETPQQETVQPALPSDTGAEVLEIPKKKTRRKKDKVPADAPASPGGNVTLFPDATAMDPPRPAPSDEPEAAPEEDAGFSYMSPGG